MFNNSINKLVVAALLSLGTRLSFAQATVDPELTDALKTMPLVQAVVTFYGDGAPQPAHVGLLQLVGITKGITLQAMPIAGVLATAAQIDELAKRPEVKSIFLNKKLVYFNNDATHLTGVKRLRADKDVTARNNGTPVSGRGIGVLINDSGVDGTHDDIKLGTHLVQNTLGTTNLNSVNSMLPVTYVEGVPNTDNNSGHGTHCAGTVGGNGARSSGKFEGVAPGASLLGYGSGGALLVLDAMGGFDYALTHQYQYNIRVISNSFGSSGTFNPNHPLSIITKKCYDRGMVVVFAAGNSGPGSNTHNPYAVAPWTISVGAGDKFGKLASFSSRGVKGEKGTFTIDGESWTFKNEPTIVAPGVDIISTRVIGPVAALGLADKDQTLAPAELPFYTYMSGTSMATPHVAGVIALILEAKPSLSPAQVKQLIERTATNMPSRESWEVGAGYINAYAAVDQAFRSTAFGGTVNSSRTFSSSVNSVIKRQSVTVNYNPATAASNQTTFTVAPGVGSLEAQMTATGLLGETGNPVTITLVDPNGAQYRAGIPVTFAIAGDRSVAVASPVAGTWTLKVEGLRGVAFPENLTINLSQQTAAGTSGLNDINGHPAQESINLAISKRLMDGINGEFRPNEILKRIHFADYLMMGQAFRQYVPTNGTKTYFDVEGNEALIAESISAKGGALRDMTQVQGPAMSGVYAGRFNPNSEVDRLTVVYALVQGLGLQQQALDRKGKPVTVQVNGKTVAIDDAAQIPAGMEGYVSVALDLNLINAFYSVTQGQYDLAPLIRAEFRPKATVSRAEFAVIVTRTFPKWDAVTQPSSARRAAEPAMTEDAMAYPNPFVQSTTIRYNVLEQGNTTVEVYNIMGQKVKTLANGWHEPGTHQVKFDGHELAKGTYVFKVNTGTRSTSKPMILH
ncbi:S8/S53 family peptidase [Fibrella forsythiae]|uniref:S8 family serine peptidase n=1 Tax=Fibrella forsythiae TaxID=2817061 RepID=A0ABS3JTM8_9BACT|nr:S8/S53 family peptidase [Fibrella forsythiae]MBO0952544.1 S8 family serine peptidase [Fibrella forsythiae]